MHQINKPFEEPSESRTSGEEYRLGNELSPIQEEQRQHIEEEQFVVNEVEPDQHVEVVVPEKISAKIVSNRKKRSDRLSKKFESSELKSTIEEHKKKNEPFGQPKETWRQKAEEAAGCQAYE